MRRWFDVALLMVVFAYMTFGGAPAAGSADSDDRLVIAAFGDPVSLDPAATISSFDQALITLTTQQLTTIAPKTGRAAPGLARSWAASPSGLQWTFKLDERRRFADGSAVTADAVKYSFERLIKMGKAGSQGFGTVAGIDSVDRSTVRIHLKSPNPVLDRLLALASASVVNPALVKSHEINGDFGNVWLSEHSAGSGPYVLASWQRGQQVVFERAPRGREPFKEIVFKEIPDPASRRLQLEKRDVDLVIGLGAREVPGYAEIKGVALAKATTPNDIIYLTLNVTRPPLNDVRVRQAIAKALDYKSLRDQVMAGNATLLNGPIPKGFPGYDSSLPYSARDLAGAKRLLAESGHPNGIRIDFGVGAFGPIAEFVQSNLKDAGIDVRLQQLASSAFDAARATGNFDMIRDGLTMDYPDPSIVMNLVFVTKAPANFSRYSNPAVDGLLNRALRELDPAKRAAMYREAQRIVVREQPVVLVASPNTVWAYRDSLSGVSINPFQPYLIHPEFMSRRAGAAGS